MEPRLANIMDKPGIVALAVAKFKTEAVGEAETPTARAPLNTACQDQESDDGKQFPCSGWGGGVDGEYELEGRGKSGMMTSLAFGYFLVVRTPNLVAYFTRH